MRRVYRLERIGVRFFSCLVKAMTACCRKAASRYFSRLAGLAIFLAVVASLASFAWALNPGALPTGGQVVAGSGSISQSGNQMTINQQTQKMIANWTTFNIGRNAGVNFIQPNSSSVALNRILDQNPSQILGSLTSNGLVFLLNPSGIIFGATARVEPGPLERGLHGGPIQFRE